MIEVFLAATAIVLPHVPGVYVGPACAGHPQRPSSSYTNRMKRDQLKALHYRDRNPLHFEEDHLVQLSLGGAAKDPKNLWPQPLRQADRDDDMEYDLYIKVCRTRTLTVSAAVKYERRYKHLHG